MEEVLAGVVKRGSMGVSDGRPQGSQSSRQRSQISLTDPGKWPGEGLTLGRYWL